MENLYNVDSPIDRVRRKNLNDTFTDILRRFNNLQMQINILSGASSVEEVLTELTEAINNANTTVAELQSLVADSVESSETATQSAIDNLNTELATQLEVVDDRLTAMQNAIDEAELATGNANTATANTTSAINDARQAVTDINNLIASMSYKGEYDASTTYNTNNIVRYGKSSYVSLKIQSGIAPSDDGVNWRLVAAGGIDGQGAVNTVNNVEPDENGNVPLDVPSKQEFNELETEFTQHLVEYEQIINDFSSVIYVSNSGNDNNDGLTQSTSLASIQKAIEIWAENRNKAGNWLIKVAAGNYAGAVIDSVRVPRELIIEGELVGGVPVTIIDGSLSNLINGLNFNGGVRARVRNIKVQNFSNSGIIFQNGSYGVIDTCDSENNQFAGFNANQYTNLDIIGTCNLKLPAGAKGIRYYRQCTGSWSDASTVITIDGLNNISDGIEIRDNSYVVAADGVNIKNCKSTGVLLRRHSYLELRTGNITNNATGIALKDLSLFANSTGALTLSNNSEDYSYQGFSLPFFNTNSYKNTVVGSSGISNQIPTTTGYDLIVNAKGPTGIQMLTDSNGIISIDFNKLGRISYGQTDHTIRFFQNNVEMIRMRTDALIPLADNTYSLGLGAYRFKDIFSGNGTISTSDRNAKQQISKIPDEVLDAWAEVEYVKYKFNDAVEEKGDHARWHFGLIAQEIAEAFERHGLNAFDYGLLCLDELEDGPRWAIRADECHFLEMALMRREFSKLKGY